MWFVGMIVGAVIGAMGRFEGAVLGAVVGAFVGALLSGKSKSSTADTRMATLEDAVRQLNERVKSLEALPGGAAIAPARDASPVIDTALLPVPEVPMPVLDAPPPAAPVSVAAVSSAVEPAPALSQPMGAPSKPAAPPPPAEPSALWNFFFGGNTLVRVGIFVLFIGVAFLLKYAADQGLVPIEVRLAGVALGGVVLLVLGWRLRAKRDARQARGAAHAVEHPERTEREDGGTQPEGEVHGRAESEPERQQDAGVDAVAEEAEDCAPRWSSVRLEPGKLFVVGDPKQSIYRFRGADIAAAAPAEP